MYVCICHKVNDKTIAEHIAQGADNRVALTSALNVGTACGRCMEHIDEMLERHYQEKAAPQRAAPILFKPS